LQYPLDFISSFALQKILLRNIDRANAVLAPDVREFCVDNRSHSAFCYLPVISIIEDPTDKQKGSADEQKTSQSIMPNKISTAFNKSSGGKSGSGGDNQSDSGSKTGIFDARQTCFFSKGKLACTLDGNQTLCYNLLTKKAGECFLEVEFERHGKKANALISIIKNKYDISLQFKNGLPKLKVSLTLTCEKEETFLREDISSSYTSITVSPEGLKALETRVYGYIDQLIDTSIKTDCDFLGLKNLTYQKHNKYFARYKDSLLKNLDYEIFVKALNLGNN